MPFFDPYDPDDPNNPDNQQSPDRPGVVVYPVPVQDPKAVAAKAQEVPTPAKPLGANIPAPKILMATQDGATGDGVQPGDSDEMRYILGQRKPAVVDKPAQAPTSQSAAGNQPQRSLVGDAMGYSTAPDGTPTKPLGFGARPPIHVDAGPKPERTDPRYDFKGLGGRFRAGAITASQAGAAPAPAGNREYPGMAVGEEIGRGLGGLVGGFINPRAAGNIQFARDLGMWQQNQEAASKAASEEIKRAQEYAQSTHRDAYSGEIDPAYKALADQRESAAVANKARAEHYGDVAKARMMALDQNKLKILENALQKGGAVPENLQGWLQENHMSVVPPPAGSKAGPHVWQHLPNGASVLMERGPDGAWRYAKHLEPGESGSVPYYEGGTPLGQGQPKPSIGDAGGEPITSGPAGGVSSFGPWKSRDEVLSDLAGRRTEFEGLGRSRAKAQQELDALNDALQERPADLSDDTKEQRQDQRRRADKARERLDKIQGDMDKIQADVVTRFGRFPGFVTARPTEQGGGWSHDEAKLPTGTETSYPFNVRTGRPKGYIPLKPKKVSESAPPPAGPRLGAGMAAPNLG